jgi:lysophospholipase L1-like esterase
MIRKLAKLLLILLITAGLYWAIDVAYGYYAGVIRQEQPPNPNAVPGLRGLPYASGDFMIEAGQTIDTEAVPGTGVLTPKEFHGNFFNIDRRPPTDLLYRRTLNPDPPKPPTIKVLLIGGSTVYGADAPDGLTIASLLSRRLNTDDKTHSYVVLNAGTFGANSTMERERLHYELDHGQKPDIVVVMDGGLDLMGGIYLGAPGRTFAEGRGQVADFFHKYFPHNIYWALRRWLSERAMKLGLKKPPANIQKPVDVDKLTKDTVAFYLDNQIAMAKLAKDAGARFITVLEPNRYAAGFSHPTDDLKFVDRQTDNHLPGLRAIMPKALAQLSAGNAGLRGQGIETLDLSTIFKDKTQNLFTDGAGHFNSIGNAMVADRLAAAILSSPTAAAP